MQNNIALELTCQRRALGLTITELADTLGVDKRVISFYERGTRKATKKHLEKMKVLSVHYSMLMTMLRRDIKEFEQADDNNEVISLPYFSNQSDYEQATGSSNAIYWRLWQSAVSHLLLASDIGAINDHDPIPASFIFTRLWYKRLVDQK